MAIQAGWPNSKGAQTQACHIRQAESARPLADKGQLAELNNAADWESDGQ